MSVIQHFNGDSREVLKTLPARSVHCCVTSPPYFGLRDYGVAGQIGLEPTPDAYVAELVAVFREVKRVLRDDGVLFLNLGDSYWGGGRGGNPEGSPHQKQRTNRGSVSMPASARHEAAYDRRGKAPEGSQVRDCFCQSLCGACRVAYRIGKSHSAHLPDSTRLVSNFGSIPEHIQSPSGHPPTLGLTLQVSHNVDATPDQRPSSALGCEPLPASLASTKPQSASPSQNGCLQASSRDGECQMCGRSLLDCVPASAHMVVCTCDTADGELVGRKTDMDTSGLAYPSYTTTSLKPKDLIGIPWRVAFALQSDGWYLRQDIIWSKPNPMPESVRDRCTKAHEYIFMLSKAERYYYDQEAIKEPAIYAGLTNQEPNGYKDATKFNGKHSDKQRGHSRRHAGFNDRWDQMEREEQCSGVRNKRSVWTVATQPFKEAHFATFPPDLIEPCIKAGCPAGGIVLDPFGGAGTTGLVADRLQRNAILIELNPTYAEMAKSRVYSDAPLFAESVA